MPTNRHHGIDSRERFEVKRTNHQTDVVSTTTLPDIISSTSRRSRPRHGDVKRATFFFQLGRGAGAQVSRHAAVDEIERIDRHPFLSLSGIDGRPIR